MSASADARRLVRRAAASGFGRLAARLRVPTPGEERAASWYSTPGHSTRRFEYDLVQTSIIFDLGGYEGQFASDMYARYRCRVHVFEPIPEYAANIRRRFASNPDIEVHDFGLSDQDGTISLSVSENESSTFKSGGPTVSARLVRAGDFLAERGIDRIDLLKVNIEGGEYDLLDHLIADRLIDRVSDLQVQFHDFVPDADARMTLIQDALARTHEPTYQFPYVWENWHRR